MQLITSLAALAASITSVNALGKAIVNNNCEFPVYLWPVDINRNPSEPTVLSPGGSYSEEYKVLSSGGVSIKVNTQPSKQYVTQFEYTVQSFSDNPFLWYDGSHVDCKDDQCPFWNYGINLKTTDPSCPTRDCEIGKVCSGFYTLWNDDINTLSCQDNVDTIFTVCSINKGGDSSASSPKQKEAAAPSSTKAQVINEAVMTTFATAIAAPSKRAEPVHHGHMHFHQRAQQ